MWPGGAEYLGRFINEYMEEHPEIRPVISSGCPTVTRLISVRFPELAENVIPLNQPMEIMAKLARERMEQDGYPKEEIGIFYIAPCTAEVTSGRLPIGLGERVIDASISVAEVFWPLFNIVKGLKEATEKPQAGTAGLRWACIAGEAKMIDKKYSTLAVDGLGHLIEVLESLSIGRLQGIDYIEGRACSVGCVGGVLNIENAYVAKEIIRQACYKRRELPFNALEEGYHWRDFCLEAGTGTALCPSFGCQAGSGDAEDGGSQRYPEKAARDGLRCLRRS